MRLNHIGLAVTDLDRARHFYSNILGFKEIERPIFLIPGLWYCCGSFQLHLMLLDKPKQAHYHPLNETVQAHFSLEMPLEQIKFIIEQLQMHGIQIIESSTKSSETAIQLFFYDFDMNLLEICSCSYNL